eukprot:TRINITY_DN25240_c0_g1_i1.p1 TRINITY_DN25240_c0_g1~~TRINITY_DN25240_c0_g1_i1.p1  ORF type:complete len:114 (-),score=9.57 TRINITY_DN25240_c0_g1_i1:589-930(-)
MKKGKKENLGVPLLPFVAFNNPPPLEIQKLMEANGIKRLKEMLRKRHREHRSSSPYSPPDQHSFGSNEGEKKRRNHTNKVIATFPSAILLLGGATNRIRTRKKGEETRPTFIS